MINKRQTKKIYVPQPEIVFFVTITNNAEDVWIVGEYLMFIDELLNFSVNDWITCA